MWGRLVPMIPSTPVKRVLKRAASEADTRECTMGKMGL